MIEIGNTIISLDVLDKPFSCDLSKCKGACCIYGDSGAPLEDEELTSLQKALPAAEKYLSEKSINALREHGVAYKDEEGDLVTTLIDGGQCAFSFINEDGICLCAIEKAFREGETPFRKPISCYLYPIRTKKYKRFSALNYDRWSICKDAITKGRQDNVQVFQFAKPALIEKYGEDWYQELNLAATHLHTHKK